VNSRFLSCFGVSFIPSRQINHSHPEHPPERLAR
jgi:hypothetical protein